MPKASPTTIVLAAPLALAFAACSDPAPIDNTSAKVTYAPDLVVAALEAPPSVRPSDPLEVRVTICNVGNDWANSSQQQLVVSTDDTITTTDTQIGSWWIPGLGQGECYAEDLTVGLPPLPQGGYYVGALADEPGSVTESDETNNTLASAQLGVGNAPDLVATVVDAPPSSAGPFDADVTICNRGTDPAGAVDVSVYLSADTTIETYFSNAMSPDFFVGNGYVSNLYPGECAVATVSGSVGGLSTGAYYVAAVVDEWGSTSELIEDNNTTLGALVGIGFGPDLIVAAIDAPPSANGSFDATLTLCNQGTTAAFGADATVILSQDTTIDSPFTNPMTNDVPIGNAYVGFLAEGTCADVTTSLNAPTGMDAPYLGVIVDESDAIVELVESNNVFVGDRIGVGFGPDVVVERITAPPSADGQFTATVRACNQGTDSASGFDVTLYASADQTIQGGYGGPFGDPFLGSAYVPYLYAGQCADVGVQAYAPGPTGAMYLGAIADESQQLTELNEYNNVHVGALTGFGNGPDLVVSSLTGPPSADGSIDVDVTVCNRGTAPTSYADVEVYLTADTVVTLGPGPDLWLGFVSFSWLGAGQCSTQTMTGNTYGGTGAYYLAAVVDPYEGVTELIESNNVTLGALVGIGNGPDLVIASIDAPPSADGSVSIDVRICNQGTSPSSSTDVSVVLTADDVVNTWSMNPNGGDFTVGQSAVPPLGPTQCATVNVQGSTPSSPSPLFVGAIVDEFDSNPELIETNNTAIGALIGLGNGPDFVVTAIDAPPSADGSATFEVTVCNQGTAYASYVDVTLYVSQDDVLDVGAPYAPPVDHQVGWASFSTLPPGQCATQSASVWLPSVGEAWYVGAIADEYDSTVELIESNNAFVGDRIGLGNGPDLVVTAATGPPSTTGSLDVDFTVCNQGTAPSPGSDVELYASEDLVLEALGGPNPPSDYPIGFAPVPSLFPGQCVSDTVAGSVPTTDGPLHLAAIVDPYDGVSELNEDNNTTFGDRIGAGFRPDFVVTVVNGPPSADGPFLVDWTVCNQGTTGGAADVTIYVSDDEVITPMTPYSMDQPIAFGNVSLAAGACANGSASANASGQGAYYLGAIVDEYENTLELIEDNNVLVGQRIGLGSGPNLFVTAVDGPPSATGSFNVDFTVCNYGTTSSYATDLNIYAIASANASFGMVANPYGPPSIAYAPVPSITAGQCHSGTTSAYPPGQGAYYLAAIVDEYESVAELIEDDNAFVGGRMGFGLGPDLVLQSVTAPAVVGSGGYADVTVVTCNQGTDSSPPSDVSVYLSTDDTIAGGPYGDYPIGYVPVPTLAAGQCDTNVSSMPLPSWQGAFWLGGVVDEYGGVAELIETNNVSAAQTVTLANAFCGNGVVDQPTEECDDGNSVAGDGCNASCFVEHAVWQENASGTVRGPYNWNYAMGYHFTPQRDGVITQLGGYFYGGPKTVRLFERDTGALLAEVQVTGQAASGQFAYGAITAVPVTQGTRYTVAVYMAGSGGTYRSGMPSFPRTFQDVRIDATTYVYTGSNANARPTNAITSLMYGQADIVFAATE